MLKEDRLNIREYCYKNNDGEKKAKQAISTC